MYSFCVLFVIRDTFYVVVFYYMFMCVSCFGLVVGTVGCRKTPLMTPLCGVEITCTKPTLKRLFMCIFFLLFVLFVLLCFPARDLHDTYFIRL